ncbi:FecR domain-containing protein [Brevundimonas sp. BH3]|uniref:FecR family protein n=1 Tax=unclassified Brevundimonas TaxID=2622653 RepID=UPI00289C20B9|nr:FecR domain-containing protein [Brevundimonas sp.]
MTVHNDAAPIEQALEWLVLNNGGQVRATDNRAFRAWLAASPEHAAAYAEAETLWAQLDWSQTLNQQSLSQTQTVIPVAKSKAPPRKMLPSRRAFMAIAAGLGTVALTPLAIQLSSGERRRFETEVGEIRHLSLEDGSRVSLGGRSILATRVGERMRHMRLDAGEAFFDVARDETRVFTVIGAGLKAEALGTAFEVRLGDHGPEVFVEEGRVRVTATATGEQTVIAAGERATLRGRVLKRAAINPASVAPWRRQRFSFIDQPLSDVVTEVNRYYQPGVTIASPELGAHRVTAAFTIEQIPHALESLAQELNGHLVRHPTADGELQIALNN